MPILRPDPNPLFDPYRVGRWLAGAIRQLRRMLSWRPPAPVETSIAWEDGEGDSGRRD